MSFFQMAAAAVQAMGAIYQGNAQAAGAEAAAGQAEANARITRQQSSANEDTRRRQSAMQMGDIRARAADSGFDPSSGSLATLQAKSAGEMELDILTKRYEDQLRAMSFDAEGASARTAAKSARRSGYLNAFATIMGSSANYMGAPRIGLPAPVESRTPKPTGWVGRDW